MRASWLIFFLAMPALGQSIPAAVYPVEGAEFKKSEVLDAQALVFAAVLRMRTRAFVLASTDPLPVSCGPAQKAATPCLAKLAGHGIVLRAVLHKGADKPFIVIDAIDGSARLVGPVRTPMDPMFQSAKPLVEAMDVLAAQLEESR
jgi:hypothetical protein